MSRVWIGMLLFTMLAGCSGEYLVTLPDVVAAAGNEAVVVARVQRHEVFIVAPPVRDAVVVMWVDPDQHRAAHTDSRGYATVMLPVPDQIGRYEITLHHQDERGDEVTATGRCYVMDASKLTVAVDWEAIEDADDARAAAAALGPLQEAGVQIVYAAEDEAATPNEAHRWLTTHGLPDGPVLSWGYRRNWRWKAQELRGSLPAAREVLGGLTIVAAGDDDLARAAAEMHMVAIGVGINAGPDSINVADWPAFADRVRATHHLAPPSP